MAETETEAQRADRWRQLVYPDTNGRWFTDLSHDCDVTELIGDKLKEHKTNG